MGSNLALVTAAAISTAKITTGLLIAYSTLIIATGIGLYTLFPWDSSVVALENIRLMPQENAIAYIRELFTEITVKYDAIQSSSSELQLSLKNTMLEIVPNVNNLTPGDWNNLMVLYNTAVKTMEDISPLENQITKIITTMAGTDELNLKMNILDIKGATRVHNELLDLHRNLQNTRLGIFKETTELANFIKLHNTDLFIPVKSS